MIKAAFVIFVTTANGGSAITPAPYNFVFESYGQCIKAIRDLQHVEISKGVHFNRHECVNLNGFKQGNQ